MLRAAAWTGGLFAVGAGVVHLLPVSAWLEPVVLAALGAGLILAGGRRAAASRGASPRAVADLAAAERAAR